MARLGAIAKHWYEKPLHRRKLSLLPVQVLVVLICFQNLTLSCLAQCDSEGFLICIFTQVNMTSDGGAKLRRIIDDEDLYYAAIRIEKLIVSNSASGPFLLRIGEYSDSISYVQYRDAVFQLPPGSTITELYIGGSGVLRTFAAGKNGGLKELSVADCLFDRIPPSLGNLVNLRLLAINNCLLTGLRMDMFAANRNLEIVNLDANKIRQLFPLTANKNTPGLTITALNLANNQIERLDMAVFAHLTELEWLDLRYNGIIQLGASAQIVFPSLTKFSVDYNKISSVDLANVTFSKLYMVILDENALTDMPSRLGKIPDIRVLSVVKNKLKRLDLSMLRPLSATLESAYFSSNQIESVQASTPISMPQLELLGLDENKLTTINLTGCELPNIRPIVLSYNLFRTVPALFQRFPNVRLIMDGNPLKCSTLMPLKNRLTDRRLTVNTLWMNGKCPTNGSIPISDEETACCYN
ncbi:AGAP007469-PA-like protein [Anopheles sinensis]|uniref:AGAP007469-PA-like protein n=1 Tax=Anopheles sinensis TaxID=74873 RepID=A0A084WN92_ANOSI|nr:AGAP007469-PA-like protein [Anopheles sinensis]